MQTQDAKLLVIAAGALAVAIAIISISISRYNAQSAASEKLANETYLTPGGAICPKYELWAKWERPQRHAWQSSQEKQYRKSAEKEGYGCYYLK